MGAGFSGQVWGAGVPQGSGQRSGPELCPGWPGPSEDQALTLSEVVRLGLVLQTGRGQRGRRLGAGRRVRREVKCPGLGGPGVGKWTRPLHQVDPAHQGLSQEHCGCVAPRQAERWPRPCVPRLSLVRLGWRPQWGLPALPPAPSWPPPASPASVGWGSVCGACVLCWAHPGHVACPAATPCPQQTLPCAHSHERTHPWPG